MGIETAIIIGLSAVSAISGMNQASSEARHTAQEGNVLAANKAKEVQARAARAQSNFLASGLTLTGTPDAAVGSIFNTGLEDIAAIRSNYDNKAKNIISSARTKAITGLVGSIGGAVGGGSGIANFGTDVGNGFTSMANGTSFDLGYSASQSFRAAGGGFEPGEFASNGLRVGQTYDGSF